MILDTLENTGWYESIHPRFKQAFDFLKNTDLEALSFGKHELDGNNLFANVVEVTGETAEQAKLEIHKRYIDIQVPVTAAETMGHIPVSKLTQLKEPYNAEKDIAFFTDKATNFIRVEPGNFVVFTPEDGHQPGIAIGKHKKVIVKVLM
jgi:YhcH/YjgK/YiaL family protein